MRTSVHMAYLTTMLRSLHGRVEVPGNSRPDGILGGAARARARSTLFSVLKTALKGADDSAVAYTSQLEACAVAHCKNDYAKYISTMARLVHNLQLNGDRIVRRFPVSAICLLSHGSLGIDTSRAMRDQDVELRLALLVADAKRSAEEATKLAESVQSANLVRCQKCKGTSEITRFSEQTRSADEGMTTFFMCKCGYRWRQT